MEKNNWENDVNDFVKINMDSVRMQELRGRAKRCCCKYCGSRLVLKEIAYGMVNEGRVELFCSECNRLEYGVEPEIYQLAKYYIKDMKWDYFSDLEESKQKDKMNIGQISEIVYWSLRKLGLLNENGFYYEVHFDEELAGTFKLVDDTFVKE